MTKERYEYLKTSEGEAELCDLIGFVLDQAQQTAAREYNHMTMNPDGEHTKEEAMEKYWSAMALTHAVRYVEDWKESL